MVKLDSLRDLLVRSVPFLAADPAKIAVFVDRGRVAARGTGSLSFEYRYTATIVVEDYAGDVDELFVPVLAWIAENAPELLDRDPREPFSFESEILGDDLADISISVDLVEAVRVSRTSDGLRVEHLPEPPRMDAFAGVPAATSLWAGVLEDVVSGTVTA